MQVQVIQNMRPDGRIEVVMADVDEIYRDRVDEMRYSGCRIEVETCGTVAHVLLLDSIRFQVLDQRTVPNGPQLQDALESLLRSASWRRKDQCVV